jgi:hypothetical protein
MTDKLAKRGRPRVEDPRTKGVTAWLSSREYAALLNHAKRHEQSLSTAVRARLFDRRRGNLTTD